jgi:hypothetical protein
MASSDSLTALRERADFGSPYVGTPWLTATSVRRMLIREALQSTSFHWSATRSPRRQPE